MPNKYSEDLKIEKSQTSAILKYNSEREESGGNNKGKIDWKSSINEESNKSEKKHEERENDLSNKFDTKMIDEEDDFEVMEEIEKNEHFECDEFDDNEMDQQIIDRKMEKNTEQKVKGKGKNEEVEEDDSDWSSSEESDNDKKMKTKMKKTSEISDSDEDKKTGNQKEEMKLNDAPKSQHYETLEDTNPQVTVATTTAKEILAENLDDLLFKL